MRQIGDMMPELVCTAPLTEDQLVALRDILITDLMEQAEGLVRALPDQCDARSFAHRVRETSRLLDAFGWCALDTTE